MQIVDLRALGAALALFVASAAVAGDLTPPGAAGPTMKTLDEVEARIPVGSLTKPGTASAVYRITQPGSYYLTGDVVGESGKSGVEISSNDVTLDLNGYALRGVVGALDGLNMTSYFTGVSIGNGVVNGWPRTGVFARIDGGVVHDLRVYGCGEWGISATASFNPRIERCTVFSCGDAAETIGGGISLDREGTISECDVRSCAGTGINAPNGVVRNCLAVAITADLPIGQPGIGIIGWLVESSGARTCAATGVQANVARGCIAANCTPAYSVTNLVESF